MLKSSIGVALLGLVVGLGGCASKEATIGAATGMALGAAVSDGGTLGTVGGALIGYGAGKAYEARHADPNR